MDFWKLRGRITTHEAISFHSAIDELPGIRDTASFLKLPLGLAVFAVSLQFVRRK